METLLARGFGLATLYYGDIEPDLPGAAKLGVRGTYLRPGQDAPAADEWRKTRHEWEGAHSPEAWAALSKALHQLDAEAERLRRDEVAGRTMLAVSGLFVFGISLFLIYPALQSCVGNAVPARNQSQAFSVASNLQMLSGALFSLVSGFLSDGFGVNTPFLLTGGLGVLALLVSPAAGRPRDEVSPVPELRGVE